MPTSSTVEKIPRRIQQALDAAKIKATGGYFTTGDVFTAWLGEDVVAVLEYDPKSKSWVVLPEGTKPRYRRAAHVAARWLKGFTEDPDLNLKLTVTGMAKELRTKRWTLDFKNRAWEYRSVSIADGAASIKEAKHTGTGEVVFTAAYYTGDPARYWMSDDSKTLVEAVHYLNPRLRKAIGNYKADLGMGPTASQRLAFRHLGASWTRKVQKLASRYLYGAAPGLADVMRTLQKLEELSENIADVTDSFEMHFRTAGALSPEVTSQLDTLKKATAGLKAAEEALKSVQSIMAAFPTDKTAQRVLKDAQTMVDRYKRLKRSAIDMMHTLSKKTMPPALKAAAAKITPILKGLLTDPSKMQIIPWQNEVLTGDYGSRIEGVQYLVAYRVTRTRDNEDLQHDHDAPPTKTWDVDLNLFESTVGTSGVLFSTSVKRTGVPFQVKDAVAAFKELLDGDPLLKGEAEANASRKPTAEAIKSALNSALRRMSAYDMEEAEASSDGREVKGAYRSELPKEGARSVGEDDYDDMVQDEIARWKKVLDPHLKPYLGSIKEVRSYDGEKSWIYTEIYLK